MSAKQSQENLKILHDLLTNIITNFKDLLLTFKHNH